MLPQSLRISALGRQGSDWLNTLGHSTSEGSTEATVWDIPKPCIRPIHAMQSLCDLSQSLVPLA